MKIIESKQTAGCGKRFSAPFHFIVALTLIAGAMALQAPTSLAATGVRSLWVVRKSVTTPGKVEELVNFASRHGYTTLFVQVRGRGDAFYRSYFVPGPENYPNIPDEFDPLERIIELAHDRGIEVHTWFNMYYTWSFNSPPDNPEHIVHSHPEWFMVSLEGVNMNERPMELLKDDNLEGQYISPLYQEVRNYLSRVITEVMVTYDIDGVHLDYVRYPGRDYDFNQQARHQFQARYGVDPVAVVRMGEAVDPKLEYLEKWADFRVSYIDQQVRSIKRRIDLVGKRIKLSAAVKPASDQAYFKFGQNWVGWLNEGIVDFVVTMSYFPETDWIEDVLRDSLKKVDRRKVIGGIGAYLIPPERMVEQVRLMQKLDLMGYSIFSYTTFTENPDYAEIVDTLLDAGDTDHADE